MHGERPDHHHLLRLQPLDPGPLRLHAAQLQRPARPQRRGSLPGASQEGRPVPGHGGGDVRRHRLHPEPGREADGKDGETVLKESDVS